MIYEKYSENRFYTNVESLIKNEVPRLKYEVKKYKDKGDIAKALNRKKRLCVALELAEHFKTI